MNRTPTSDAIVLLILLALLGCTSRTSPPEPPNSSAPIRNEPLRILAWNVESGVSDPSVTNNIGETKDLSGKEPTKVAELHAMMKAGRERVGADSM